MNMIAYHIIWDLIYIFNLLPYQSAAVYIWQQGICRTFILLSGFCCSLSRHKVKRGLTVLFSGFLISAVTRVVLPQDKVIFGVLTLIGSCMLLIIPLSNILKRFNPFAGIIFCIILFLITKNINYGYIGFGNFNIYMLPEYLYRNTATAYLGFPPYGFFSADYFPLFPWIFIFICGYFLYNILNQKKMLHYLEKKISSPVEWFGKNSLIIYLLHQPAIYLILTAMFKIIHA